MKRKVFDIILYSIAAIALIFYAFTVSKRHVEDPDIQPRINLDGRHQVRVDDDALQRLSDNLRRDSDRAEIKKQQEVTEEERNTIDVEEIPRDHIQWAVNRGVDVN